MFSNLLLYAYEMKAVDDPFVSDRALSLDHFYLPLIKGRPLIFQIISPNFLFLASAEPTDKWPQKLIITDEGVLTDFVQSVRNFRHRGEESPTIDGGLIKVHFVNRSIYAHDFYTPYFNMRKIPETP